MTTRARRSFNGADPTPRAVLAMNTLPPVETLTPAPAGGVTISDAARLQALSFGMKPYEIAAMQRSVAAKPKKSGESGNLEFRRRKVYFSADVGLFTITRVQ